MPTLQERIVDWLAAEGWQVTVRDGYCLSVREVILSQWLFGSRRVRLRLDMTFEVACKVLHYQETAIEQAHGLPPPTFSFAVSTQVGREVTENRIDSGWGAGGRMRYGDARQVLKRLCEEAGWSFKLHVGAPV